MATYSENGGKSVQKRLSLCLVVILVIIVAAFAFLSIVFRSPLVYYEMKINQIRIVNGRSLKVTKLGFHRMGRAVAGDGPNGGYVNEFQGPCYLVGQSKGGELVTVQGWFYRAERVNRNSIPVIEIR